ncbi:MAG: phosphate acetyltransferase [Candidatus Cloacimonetes bacterium]|nr:phosphate acetyltransferase [Candidatus Cloacimonadota bacterium]
MNIIASMKEKAKAIQGTVVLPEAWDVRTLAAARILLDEGTCKVILVGDPITVMQDAAANDITTEGFEVWAPDCHPDIEKFADYLFERRKAKGMSRDEAAELVRRPLYFGVSLVHFGIVGGMVAGAASTTADVLRVALHIVGVTPGLKTVSSSFIMVVPDTEEGDDRVFLFADCAVVPVPTAEQLADIAQSTALTCRQLLGEEPRVALLSFATRGSSEHELVDKVRQAKAILEERGIDFAVDGELQADAAIVPSIGERKAPDSPVAGKANVLIFPDLQSGNIGYKLVQRLAGAEAVGPVIQGLAAPVCDLSRGCSVEDIANTAVLVVLMSQR